MCEGQDGVVAAALGADNPASLRGYLRPFAVGAWEEQRPLSVRVRGGLDALHTHASSLTRKGMASEAVLCPSIG
ncbi:hypothetical protein CBM2634_B60075 [Cupriavidus taiwanensis]|uniref:Uncharacterized protein n=1 Tax=Cupriavidus taiwanensis TaxID=164546 RepID=A0A375J9V5_9BURK|nr:hypothetical protein CBM2634_B60075 [Cupriavidus taiwanensis]